MKFFHHLLIALFLFSANFFAQSDNEDYTLEEIIVTAQKTEKSLQDVPIAVSALSGSIRESLSTQSNYYEIDVEITNGSNTYDLISKIEITSTGPKVYMRKIGKYL